MRLRGGEREEDETTRVDTATSSGNREEFLSGISIPVDLLSGCWLSSPSRSHFPSSLFSIDVPLPFSVFTLPFSVFTLPFHLPKKNITPVFRALASLTPPPPPFVKKNLFLLR